MNQKQLSLFIRHAFSLTNAEKDALKGANPAFATAMTRIRRLVESLPEEALLQDKAWKKLRPQVMQALQPYNDSFRESILDSLEGISKEVEENVVKSLEAIKAPAPIGTSGPIRNAPTGQLQAFGNRILAENVQSALSKTSIANVKLEKLFRVNPELDTPTSLWMKQNFQTIDRTVRTGILQGASTESIAKEISEEITKSGLLRATKDTATGKIKGQANTVARTAIQSFNRQITEQVWDANADALEGLVYEWTSALDSRVCPTCGPLDGQKKPERGDLPETPIHPNCRCNVVVVDPDEDDDVRTAIQLSETKPTGKGSYASKVRVNGKLFYRKAVEIKPKGATYADYLADMAKKSKDKNLSPAAQKSAGVTLAEYFGGAGKVGQGESTLGVERADWFTQATKKGMRPDDALKRLVTDPDRVTKLRSFKTEWDRGIDPPKPKAPKPKPKPPAPKPKPVAPKPVPKTLQGSGKDLIGKVAPELNSYVSIVRKSKIVYPKRVEAIVNAVTKEDKLKARKAYNRAMAIEARAQAKINGAMDKVKKAMLETDLTKQQQKAFMDNIEFEGWLSGRKGNQQIKEHKEIVSEFMRMFNGKGFTATTNGTPWVKRISPDLFGRGSNNPKRGHVNVRIGSRENMFHELMHTVEAQRPSMLQDAKDWIISKAYDEKNIRLPDSLKGQTVKMVKGKPQFRLKDITGMDYRESEVAWTNDFINGYMGKDYGEESLSTEVWTVGVEHFADTRRMGSLFRRHPDLFQMIVGLSRGS